MTVRMKQLPKMARGEGTMACREDGTIMFRKMVKVSETQTKRVTVYGETVREVMALMAQKEKEALFNKKKANNRTLEEEMTLWYKDKKRGVRESTALGRIGRIKSMAKVFPVFHKQWKFVKEDELQNTVFEMCGIYAYGTIMSSYSLIKAFYKDKVAARELLVSPMANVKLPPKEMVATKDKQIVYMNSEQIKVFVTAALQKSKTVNTYKLSSGPALVFTLYTGCRIGEVCALKWGKVDLNRKIMLIDSTLTKRKNPLYDETRPQAMEAQKIPKTIQCVGGVKNKKSRYVPLNDMAIKMLEIQQRLDKNLGADDFVFCGKNAVRYDENRMYHDIRTLIRAANLNLPRCGPHMLRHTCASMLFKNGIDVETIASVLGHTPEMCRKTYLHLYEEQRVMAMQKLNNFDLDVLGIDATSIKPLAMR